MRAPLLPSPACAALGALLGVLLACRVPVPCSGDACQVACPRDADVDASGRCSCRGGALPVLGACVPPPVADAYCGRAGRASSRGCAFVACGPEEAVDLDVGCVPIVSLAHTGAAACSPGASLVVAASIPACVPPDVACPRGSRSQGATCARPAQCPPGTLAVRDVCHPVVLRRQGGGGTPIVDVGAWAALALGLDGGLGAADLCRPLQAHPAAFGLDRGETLAVDLHVAITVPDEDMTRVLSDVRVTAAHPLPPAAAPVAASAVATLLEALRGLGGESSATRVETRVTCTITSL